MQPTDPTTIELPDLLHCPLLAAPVATAVLVDEIGGLFSQK